MQAVDETVRQLREHMSRAAELAVPLKVDVGIGPTGTGPISPGVGQAAHWAASTADRALQRSPSAKVCQVHADFQGLFALFSAFSRKAGAREPRELRDELIGVQGLELSQRHPI